MKKVGKLAGLSVLIGSLILLAIYAIFISVTGVGAYAAYEAEITARAKSQNFYLTGADLLAANLQPESTEQSKILFNAFSQLKLYQDKDESKFLESWKRNEALVSTIEKNLDVKRYFLDRGYDDVSNVDYSDLSGMKSLVKAYCRLAAAEFKRGNRSEGVTLLCQATLLGQLVSDEPNMIASLVQVACDAICLESIRSTLNEQALSTNDLKRLEQSVSHMTSQIDGSTVLRSECLSFIQVSNNLEPLLQSAKHLSDTDRPKLYALKYVPRLRNAAYAYGVEAWLKVAAIIDVNSTDLDRIEAGWAEVEKAANSKQLSGALLSIYMPASFGWSRSFRKHVATRSVVQQALAYKIARQSGKPIQISDLPTVMDMDKKPIRKVRKGNATLIYSVAPDGIDNGGTPRSNNLGLKYDFVVSIRD
jgi:hypothetical protein